MNLRVLSVVAVAVVSAVVAAPAHAGFGPPTDLLLGDGIYAVSPVADATGTATVTGVMALSAGGVGLVTRPREGAWSSPVPVVGGEGLGVVGPVIAAAGGDGGLAVAWGLDQPLKPGGLALAVRDPGSGALGESQTIVAQDGGGARDAAVAMDRRGDVVLAYNIVDDASQLGLRGGVAIVLRTAGQPAGEAHVVDPGFSTRPAVAIGPDGRGIIAWSRAGHVYTVAVDAVAATVGAVTVRPAGTAVSSVVAAAGPGGAATVAWVSSGVGPPGQKRYESWIGVVRRAPGHRFAGTVKVGVSRDELTAVGLAADERGTATLAWSPQVPSRNRRVGVDGVTTTTFTATAAPGRPFGARHVLVPGGHADCSTPSVAAASGRTALAWSCVGATGRADFQTAIGAPAPGPPKTIASAARAALNSPPDTALTTLDGLGTATIYFSETDPVGSPTVGTLHFLAVTSDPTTSHDPQPRPR
jgi:hypothetical protein